MRTADMRRDPMKRLPLLLIASLFSPALLACENLLVGTWQSDADATMSFNRAHAKLEKRQELFFGQLVRQNDPRVHQA